MSQDFLLKMLDLIEKDAELRDATIRLMNAIALSIEIKNAKSSKRIFETHQGID